MEDTQLHSLRRDPSLEFTERLRSRLAAEPPRAASAPAWWTRRLLIAAPAAAIVAALLTLPVVRASAQSFLAMFRTVNFLALEVDADRLESLRSQQLDIPQLIGERFEVLEDGGAPFGVVSVEQASAASGIEIREPSYLPRLPGSAGTRTTLATIEVTGQHRGRATADANRLQEVLDLLGIADLGVPPGLHGQSVTVRVPPVVTLRYEQAGAWVRLMQAAKPEVLLPSDVDLPALGEIGLRILGLPPGEAREFAQAIDWQSTLLVPVPPAATSFRQVDVNGAGGVAIERTVVRAAGGAETVHLMFWSAGDRVLALEGTFAFLELLQMARSIP